MESFHVIATRMGNSITECKSSNQRSMKSGTDRLAPKTFNNLVLSMENLVFGLIGCIGNSLDYKRMTLEK